MTKTLSSLVGQPPAADPSASPALSDRYTCENGLVFMSGNQALVRLPIQQRRRDQRAGLNTGGFISGYRGSPLGRLDMELWQNDALLRELGIHFQPGVNEDLAATAIWGTQYVPILPGGRVDGVFGLWYGKGPGVDRSGDVFKHANASGTSALGGVLALAGDDHGAKSSTQAHQSEQAFIAAGMPVLYPSTVQEILDYGLLGIAMSRYAGCWVAMKLVTDVVEGSGTVIVDTEGPVTVFPPDPENGGTDRYVKRYQPPTQQEAQLYNVRLPAALAFARANGLNRIHGAREGARVGIVSCGKSWTDTQLALERLAQQGLAVPREQLRLLKVGMTWPLDGDIVAEFAKGLESILVIEEKRPLLEEQIKTILFDTEGLHPRVVGKFRQGGAWTSVHGQPLIPQVGELSPMTVAAHIAEWLGLSVAPVVAPLPVAGPAAERPPTFCSGCPHSTSTRVPDGSMALAGIGCHSIALLLDPVRTGPISHMGAEGAMWVGQSPFSEHRHVFANIGDGTYYHSGFLAIRQAVAAKVSITYKLLLNGFVSMTGGQPIEGELTPRQLATELLAEGVTRVVVVTDDPGKYGRQALPESVALYHRDELDNVQRGLREHHGVSVLIYDQMCATERRRQRKRGKLPDPAKRSFIHPSVCEGCGDCGEQSNCLSIEPLQTELGRKRQINQASCNKDFSCIKGFCPSFVTVHGGQLRKSRRTQIGRPDVTALPAPVLPVLERPMGLIVTGIGGTGVITVGAIVTMAAHLDGIDASALDLTGLAQKYGAVMSHIRLAPTGATAASYRLGQGDADVVLGCDLIVTASKESTERMDRGRTRVVLNTELSPTREFARNPDWAPDAEALFDRIKVASAEQEALPATAIAQELMGDPVAANMFVLGVAWQHGWIPISADAIEQAIRLNGVSVDANLDSFAWGRLAAHAPERIEAARRAVREAGGDAKVLNFVAPPLHRLSDIIEHRSGLLRDYQDAAYAQRYRSLVERVALVEEHLGGKGQLARAVARYYYKLLAYKDEFEVARLFAAPEFKQAIDRQFEGNYKLHFHLGGGPFADRDPKTGAPRKREVGPWVMPAMRVLARLRFLRGTWLDPFRRSAERRMALAALAAYEADIERLLAELDAPRCALAAEIASLPETLRGYGHVREAHASRHAVQRERLWQRWALAAKAAA